MMVRGKRNRPAANARRGEPAAREGRADRAGRGRARANGSGRARRRAKTRGLLSTIPHLLPPLLPIFLFSHVGTRQSSQAVSAAQGRSWLTFSSFRDAAKPPEAEVALPRAVDEAAGQPGPGAISPSGRTSSTLPSTSTRRSGSSSWAAARVRRRPARSRSRISVPRNTSACQLRLSPWPRLSLSLALTVALPTLGPFGPCSHWSPQGLRPAHESRPG